MVRKTAAILAVLLVLIGVGWLVYQQWHQRWVTLSANNVKQLNGRVGTAPGSDQAAQVPSTSGSSGTPAQGGSGSQPTGSQAPAAAPVYCGVRDMPQGVCTVIESVEKDGLKNNPYVSADTSQVPAGTTVQIDRSSWRAVAPDNNTVDFKTTIAGTTYQGTATLQLIGSVWKVTTYNLH
jgi:hypothetical protein